MALRTTQTLVEGILSWDEGTYPDATPFITVANELVTELCTNSGYTDIRLELIERWLSAHFVQIADQALDMDEVDSLRTRFQSKVDLGLNQTKYGQQALRFDTKMNLALLDNRVKAAGAKPTYAQQPIGVWSIGGGRRCHGGH